MRHATDRDPPLPPQRPRPAHRPGQRARRGRAAGRHRAAQRRAEPAGARTGRADRGPVGRASARDRRRRPRGGRRRGLPGALRRRGAGQPGLPRPRRDPLAARRARAEPGEGRGDGGGRRRAHRRGRRPPARLPPDRRRVRPARPRRLRRLRPLAAPRRGAVAGGVPAGRPGRSRVGRGDRRPPARRPRSPARPRAAGRARRARHPLLRRPRRHGDRVLRGRHRPHPGRHPLPARRMGRRLGALDRAAHRRHGVATWLLGHAADRMRFAGVRRVLDYAILAPDPPTARTRSCATSVSTSSRAPPGAGSWSSLPPCPGTPSCCAGSTSGRPTGSRWPT